MIDKYYKVRDFDMCENSDNAAVRWPKNLDIRAGVSFRLWKQSTENVSSESECTSKGGVYRETMYGTTLGRCYSY